MSKGDQTHDSIETPADAVCTFDRLLQDHGKRKIMTKEYAQRLIDAFADEGVTADDFHFQKLKHLDRVSQSDEPAIGYGDFTADLTEALGLEVERPTYGGHGLTAQRRVEKNWPTLVEYVGVEDEVETEADE